MQWGSFLLGGPSRRCWFVVFRRKQRCASQHGLLVWWPHSRDPLAVYSSYTSSGHSCSSDSRSSHTCSGRLIANSSGNSGSSDACSGYSSSHNACSGHSCTRFTNSSDAGSSHSNSRHSYTTRDKRNLRWRLSWERYLPRSDSVLQVRSLTISFEDVSEVLPGQSSQRLITSLLFFFRRLQQLGALRYGSSFLHRQ